MPRKLPPNSVSGEKPRTATTAQERTDAAVKLIQTVESEKRADNAARLRAAREERDRSITS